MFYPLDQDFLAPLTNNFLQSKGEAVVIYFADLNSNHQDFGCFYARDNTLCLLKCLLRELGSEQAKSHRLCFQMTSQAAFHRWCILTLIALNWFSPFLFVFLKEIFSFTQLSLKSSSIRFWSIATNKEILYLAYCQFQTGQMRIAEMEERKMEVRVIAENKYMEDLSM